MEDKAKRKGERLFLDRKGGNHNIYVEYKEAKSWPEHWHSYFELEIIDNGCGMHTLGGEEYEVFRGHVYILSPTDFHKMEPHGSLRLWNISFNEAVISNEMLCRLSSKETKKTFFLDDNTLDRVMKIAELLSDEAKRADEGCCVQLCECLLEILLRENGEAAFYNTDRYSRITDAIMYMENHFTEPLTLKQVADRVGFNTNYFSDLFHKITGETFCQRLNILRINHAKNLLSRGFSVSDACFGSGFGSVSNFIYRFKKSTGVAPSAYAKPDDRA